MLLSDEWELGAGFFICGGKAENQQTDYRLDLNFSTPPQRNQSLTNVKVISRASKVLWKITFNKRILMDWETANDSVFNWDIGRCFKNDPLKPFPFPGPTLTDQIPDENRNYWKSLYSTCRARKLRNRTQQQLSKCLLSKISLSPLFLVPWEWVEYVPIGLVRQQPTFNLYYGTII